MLGKKPGFYLETFGSNQISLRNRVSQLSPMARTWEREFQVFLGVASATVPYTEIPDCFNILMADLTVVPLV